MSKHSEQSDPRYVRTPFEMIKRLGSLVDAAIYCYIEGWQHSTKSDKVCLHAGRSRIAVDLCQSEDTVQRSLKRLEALGLIGYKRYPRGLWLTTHAEVMKEWGQTKQNASSVITQNASSVITQNASSEPSVITQNASSNRPSKLRHQKTQNASSNYSPSLLPSVEEGYSPNQQSINQALLSSGADDSGGQESGQSDRQIDDPFEALPSKKAEAAFNSAGRTTELPSNLLQAVAHLGNAAGNWLTGMIVSGAVPSTDWRLAETFRIVIATGNKPGAPAYYEKVFNGLPVTQPTHMVSTPYQTRVEPVGMSSAVEIKKFDIQGFLDANGRFPTDGEIYDFYKGQGLERPIDITAGVIYEARKMQRDRSFVVPASAGGSLGGSFLRSMGA